jgi:hypothetical protein
MRKNFSFQAGHPHQRPLTFTYVVFYILFLPDTWQILIGLAAAFILAPRVISAQTGVFGNVMLYVMIATIGYAASRLPARGITRLIRKLILGDRSPGDPISNRRQR